MVIVVIPLDLVGDLMAALATSIGIVPVRRENLRVLHGPIAALAYVSVRDLHQPQRMRAVGGICGGGIAFASLAGPFLSGRVCRQRSSPSPSASRSTRAALSWKAPVPTSISAVKNVVLLDAGSSALGLRAVILVSERKQVHEMEAVAAPWVPTPDPQNSGAAPRRPAAAVPATSRRANRDSRISGWRPVGVNSPDEPHNAPGPCA
ncbi:hypothetical protein [Streptomyces sp. NPDC058373]|uniref:hypothetical protein n=1 Tax=Streptomyces sp. NPDC058373 TaxID=3346465 RepID=UPI00365F3BE0